MPNHFDATFGVEIECFLPLGSTFADAAAAVTTRLGSTGRCVVEALNHQTKTHWKVVTDGSLGDVSRGCEFVSPVLVGEPGLAQVETVLRALSDLGCTVNRACGLHVHVGVGSPPLDFFKNLVKLYSVFEPVIDSMMPPSRRASTNSYCRSITSARPVNVDRATHLNGVIEAMCGQHSQMSKYYKLNLLPYSRQRTVEFRQHSATLDSRKARMWIVTCLRMVNAAKGSPALASSPAVSVNRARPGSKAFQIGEMFLRPEGVSGREVCRAMNWPSVSMPQQARAAGIEFTTQRMGREVRYFARSATEVQPTAPVTVEGLAQTIGSTDEERSYMQTRVADLAGSHAWAA